MSAKHSCSPLCNELLRGTAWPARCGSARCCRPVCSTGSFAWGREEVKVPPTNSAGVKACPTGTLVGVTAHLQPCDLMLHGLLGSCDLSCLLEAGGCALSALHPWGCAGVPASPSALESAEWLCMSFSLCLLAAGNHVPSVGGAAWGGVVRLCLGSISAAA